MWETIKNIPWFAAYFPNEHQVLDSLYGDLRKRNLVIRILMVVFEFVMLATISVRPGGPFAKPRRIVYFILYLTMVLSCLLTIWIQYRNGQKKEQISRRYFAVENLFWGFVSIWGVAVTLNDQLGGNGISVYVYTMLVVAVFAHMKPWKTGLLFLIDFLLLNVLLPFFPDPNGLDHTYNNMMNSFFVMVAGSLVAANLYNYRMQARSNELLLQEKYCNAEKKNLTLRQDAYIDSLTNLNNRNSYESVLRDFEETPFVSVACAYIDVNGLHEINNSLGHEAGDVLLRTVAAVLSNYFRAEDLFRIGGDEFVVLCRDIPKDVMASRLKEVRHEVEKQGYALSVGSDYGGKGVNVRDLLQVAEIRMQNNKREFYAGEGGDRQKRMLNERMETILKWKRDADAFLGILAPMFKGVYFVNTETDKLRQLFLPQYFNKLLMEAENHYKPALLRYADLYVKPQYRDRFVEALDYEKLWKRLKRGSVWGFSYEKTDNTWIKLVIVDYSKYGEEEKETL